MRRTIQDGREGRRVRTVTGVVLSLIAAASASAGESEDLRAGRASGDAAELARAQAVLVDLATREWGTGGSERRALRDSMVRLQRSLERANADLASAADIAVATANSVPESGASERVAQIEAQAKEAGDRIRTRWLNQQAALDRERLERERAAAERERSLR